jgi:LytR cell envelope-related transcriptional attenuator
LDHSLAPAPPFELGARNWRRLTIAIGAAAAAAIVLLVVAVILIVPALAHHLKPARATTTIPQGAVGPHTPAGRAKLSPAQTPVMVLNGNGRGGAAAASAHTIRSLGYRLGLVGNAQRMDYPVSIVMYRPGLRAEGLKFAKKVGVPAAAVGPLDGIRVSKLGRAKLVYILGAS